MATSASALGHRRSAARARNVSPTLLLLPAGLFIGLLLVCSLAVLRLSLGMKNAEWTAWSLAHYAGLWDTLYIRVFAKTIWLAFISAVITNVIAFPIALYMARTPSAALRRLVLIGVMLPMLMSLLVQSYGWIVILGPNGLVNQTIAAISGHERATSLLFNEFGVLLGLVQTTVPLAVLPILSALRNISPALEEAAGVLGASRLRVYAHILLPLAWPGILAGSLLVFGFNTGAFVVPLLLGGLKVTTVALLIRDQMGPLLDWPFGSALSVVLIALAIAVQAVYLSLSARKSRGMHDVA